MASRSSVLLQMSQVMRANLVLAPDGIDFTNGADLPPTGRGHFVHRLHVDVHYGGGVLQVLALVGDGETDLMMIDGQSEILPEDELDLVEPPDGTSLLDHMTWLVAAIHQHQRGVAARNEDIRQTLDTMEGFKDMQVITDYEVCTVGDRVTFLIKANLPNDNLSSFQTLLEGSMLVNSNDDFFIVKMVFDRNTGRPVPREFALQLSLEVVKILPPSDTLGIPRMTGSAENVQEYFMNVKDGVERHLARARKSFKLRARFILSLANIFTNNIGRIDSEMMQKMSIIFLINGYKVIVLINLDKNFPNSPPTYTIRAKKNGNGNSVLGKVVPPGMIPFSKDWSMEKNALQVGNMFADGGRNIITATFTPNRG